ncbi:MAG: DUF6714 family protein, partial [Planctomycetota bacterium]
FLQVRLDVQSGTQCGGRTAEARTVRRTMSTEAESLHRAIRSAFEHAQPPKVVTTCTCEDCHSVSFDFVGQRWTDLPAALLRRHAADLCLLEDEAFAHYLPAYLIAGLSDHGEGFVSSACISLESRSNLDLLDSAQNQAVVSWLRYHGQNCTPLVASLARRVLNEWQQLGDGGA